MRHGPTLSISHEAHMSNMGSASMEFGRGYRWLSIRNSKSSPSSCPSRRRPFHFPPSDIRKPLPRKLRRQGNMLQCFQTQGVAKPESELHYHPPPDEAKRLTRHGVTTSHARKLGASRLAAHAVVLVLLCLPLCRLHLRRSCQQRSCSSPPSSTSR
jgi:hypothetical protein